MTTPMYTGFTPYLEGVTGCNEGVTCLRAQRPLPRFVHPSAETLLRPDSMRITLRSVLIRRQRVEFSREFEGLVLSKLAMVPPDVQILSRIQGYHVLCQNSCWALRRCSHVAKLRGCVRKYVTPSLHPLHPRNRV